MKLNAREKLIKVITFVLAALVPLLLIVYGIQTKRYADLSREINELEKKHG